MLRQAQHERKIIDNINSPPFVLSVVEGLPKVFRHLASKQEILMNKRVHKKESRIAKQTRAMLTAAKKRREEDREKRENEFPADEEIARTLKDSNAGDDW